MFCFNINSVSRSLIGQNNKLGVIGLYWGNYTSQVRADGMPHCGDGDCGTEHHIFACRDETVVRKIAVEIFIVLPPAYFTEL